MSRLGGSIDANVLVRLMTNDIPDLYQQANALITSGSTYKVADVAWIEAVYALNEYYKAPRPIVREAVLALVSNRNLIFNEELLLSCLGLYTDKPALSVEDCYLACAASIDSALPLWTFDKKLAKQSSGMAKLLD
jgi:predicted nucleic-acid-binding protein